MQSHGRLPGSLTEDITRKKATSLAETRAKKKVKADDQSPTTYPTYLVSYFPTHPLTTTETPSDKKISSEGKKSDKNKHDKTTPQPTTSTTERGPPSNSPSSITVARQPHNSPGGRTPAVSVSRPLSHSTETERPSVPPSMVPDTPSQLPSVASSEVPSAVSSEGVTSLEPTTRKKKNKKKDTMTAATNAPTAMESIDDKSLQSVAKPSTSTGLESRYSAANKVSMTSLMVASSSKNDSSWDGNKVSMSFASNVNDETESGDGGIAETKSQKTSFGSWTGNKASLSFPSPSANNKSESNATTKSQTTSAGWIGNKASLSFSSTSSNNNVKYDETKTGRTSTPALVESNELDKWSGKVSLVFPGDMNTKEESKKEVTSTTPSPAAFGFKPISYYTATPTEFPTALNDKDAKGKEATPLPTVSNVDTSEPTYFIYPTNAPTSREISHDPTAWPTYVPTNTERGEASGRQNPVGGDGDGVTFINGTSNCDEMTNVDIMPLKPTNITYEKQQQKENGDYDAAMLPNLYEKQVCPGYPFGRDPSQPKLEREVFFAYGVQTNDSTGNGVSNAVEQLQRWILEDVATNVLRCDERRMLSERSNEYNTSRRTEETTTTISRVYYMEEDSISVLSKC